MTSLSFSYKRQGYKQYKHYLKFSIQWIPFQQWNWQQRSKIKLYLKLRMAEISILVEHLYLLFYQVFEDIFIWSPKHVLNSFNFLIEMRMFYHDFYTTSSIQVLAWLLQHLFFKGYSWTSLFITLKLWNYFVTQYYSGTCWIGHCIAFQLVWIRAYGNSIVIFKEIILTCSKQLSQVGLVQNSTWFVILHKCLY